MKLEKSHLGRELIKPLNKQLRDVMRKYEVDNRKLNRQVRAMVRLLKYPIFQLEYTNGIYVMTVRTADPRVDHIAIYIRENGCEARVPWGFGRGTVEEVAEYVAKI